MLALATEQPAVLLRRQLAAAGADCTAVPAAAAASRSNSPYVGPSPGAPAPAMAALQLPPAAASAGLPPPPPLSLKFDGGLPTSAAVVDATASCSHSHASSLAVADPIHAAALLADEASTPRPRGPGASPLGVASRQQPEERDSTGDVAAAVAGEVAAAEAVAAVPAEAEAAVAAAAEAAAEGAIAAEAEAPPALDEVELEEDTDADGRGWQHALVTCPWLFKPCPTCAPTHTGRESLMTWFTPSAPRTRGLCGFCPDRAQRAATVPMGLLQIRRSTYHEVVKAGDLGRIADVSGIQHYVINGAKVVFLRPRPQPRPPKGVTAPSRCVVDGRQLMDGAARYCSLQCKLEGEDPAFEARHALAAAHAQVAAAQLAIDLAAGGGPASAAAANAAASGDAAHAAGDQATVVGSKRAAAGLMRFEAGGADDSDDGGEAADQQAGPSGSAVPRWGARGKRQRAAAAGVALASAAARGVAAPPAAAAAAHPGSPGAASPATSHDSGRSSTCRWHAKRRKGEPMRAPLQ